MVIFYGERVLIEQTHDILRVEVCKQLLGQICFKVLLLEIPTTVWFWNQLNELRGVIEVSVLLQSHQVAVLILLL